MEKEFLSEWFIAGLTEIGMTEEQYHAQNQKEKNKTREYLAELGHC